MDHNPSLLNICKALANQEFVYYYQPIISLTNGRYCGAEALLRWQRPDGEMLLPAAFLPLAIAKGFMPEMTVELAPRMIADLAEIAARAPGLTVYLNLSGGELETETLVSVINDSLAARGIAASRLGIEIVESVLMPPNPKIRSTIFDFADRGFPVVLNDFSAGNTTLNYLSQLPLAAIKLSMNIVQRAPLSRMDFRVLRHLVSMGHQLRLDVIAEGIENHELYDLVLSTGCTAAQGYYYSYPLPLPDFLAALETQTVHDHYPFGLEYLAQIDHIDFRRDVIREALIIYNSQDEAVRQRALERLPLMEHTQCLLSEWYYGVGQQWGRDPDYLALGRTHHEFHETAKTLLQAAQAGERWPLIDQLIAELTRQSGDISIGLQKFARQGLKQHYAPPEAHPAHQPDPGGPEA